MGEPSRIEHYSDTKFLMYANANESGYGYVLIPIASRYNRNPTIIPDDVIAEVIQNASRSYPILLIDGYHLDSLFDTLARGENKSAIFKAWGDFPRTVVGSKETDSVEEFRECHASSEAVTRIILLKMDTLTKQILSHNKGVNYHKNEIKKELGRIDKVRAEIKALREKLI